MYNQKIFFALAVFAGLLITGCGKDDPKGKENNLETGTVTDIDLDKVMKYPYSELTPEEQKAKLEQESIEFLEMGNALKTSPAVKTLQYLNDLFDQDSPDINIWKEVSDVKEIFEIANVYGVFTWDDSKKEWTETASTSELKFIFPADKNSTSNNALLSVEAENSGIEYIYKYEDWYWDGETEKIINREEVYYLPKSAVGILAIDNKEVAKIEFAAEYKDDKEVPVKTEFKVTTSDEYTYWCKVEKGSPYSRIETQLTYQESIMMEALFLTGAKIDDIVDQDLDGGEIDFTLLDGANGYMKLLDNLVVVYQVDIENLAREIDKIEADYDQKMDALYEDWEAWEKNRNRYVLEGLYRKERSDKIALVTNRYVKAALSSIKEDFKIADLIGKSEKDDECWDSYYWDSGQGSWVYDWNRPETKKYDYYVINPYLKFNDNTLIEASVYFSEGFKDLEVKWEDFVNAFDR